MFLWLFWQFFFFSFAIYRSKDHPLFSHVSVSPRPFSPQLLNSKPHVLVFFFRSNLTPNPFQKEHSLWLFPMQPVCLMFVTPKCHILVFSPIPAAFWEDPTYWLLHHWLLLVCVGVVCLFVFVFVLIFLSPSALADWHSWPICWWNYQKILPPVGNSANHCKKQPGIDKLIFHKERTKLQLGLFILCSHVIQWDTDFSLSQ